MRAGAIGSPGCQWTLSSPVCRTGPDLVWLGLSMVRPLRAPPRMPRAQQTAALSGRAERIACDDGNDPRPPGHPVRRHSAGRDPRPGIACLLLSPLPVRGPRYVWRLSAPGSSLRRCIRLRGLHPVLARDSRYLGPSRGRRRSVDRRSGLCRSKRRTRPCHSRPLRETFAFTGRRRRRGPPGHRRGSRGRLDSSWFRIA